MYTATKSVCAKVDEQDRLKIRADQTSNQMASIADQLKGLMAENGINKLTACSHLVIYKSVDMPALEEAAGQRGAEAADEDGVDKAFRCEVKKMQE